MMDREKEDTHVNDDDKASQFTRVTYRTRCHALLTTNAFYNHTELVLAEQRLPGL